ncbi:MAG TPA: site-specific DNA-methyltransferase [Bacteroidetes bacterium]|nr:site-specific DNA-methyltransferase [Bacteroidota bacterium]
MIKYTIQNLEENYSIVAEDVEKYLKANELKIPKNGKLSKKVYQGVLDFYTNNGNHEPRILNGSKPKEKPVFESNDKRVAIYQQDVIAFLKSLPSNSVDLIVTDPAYSGMNQKLKLGKGKIIGRYKDRGENGKWFEEFLDTEDNYSVFLKECFRVMKDNRHIFLMFDSYSLLTLAPLVRDVFEVKNILVWDKVNIGLGHYFRRRHEFILFASKGKRKVKLRSIPDIWNIKRFTHAPYPTQKPTEIFELMLVSSADEDFVVCDPFLGSGASAIASIKKNCRFIGCDISETAIEKSTNRIKEFIETGKDNMQKNPMHGNDEKMIKILQGG